MQRTTFTYRLQHRYKTFPTTSAWETFPEGMTLPTAEAKRDAWQATTTAKEFRVVKETTTTTVEITPVPPTKPV